MHALIDQSTNGTRNRRWVSDRTLKDRRRLSQDDWCAELYCFIDRLVWVRYREKNMFGQRHSGIDIYWDIETPKNVIPENGTSRLTNERNDEFRSEKLAAIQNCQADALLAQFALFMTDSQNKFIEYVDMHVDG